MIALIHIFPAVIKVEKDVKKIKQNLEKDEFEM